SQAARPSMIPPCLGNILLGVFPFTPVLFPEQSAAASWRRWLMIIIAALTCTGGSGAAVAGAERFQLTIPAQRMDLSLHALAVEAGAQTLFPFDALSALEAPALEGEYTIAEALQALLDNTGYQGWIN